MKIQDIINILEDDEILDNIYNLLNEKEEVLDITYDSRECKKGTCFFCKGASFKREYLEQAIIKGASFAISEKKIDDVESLAIPVLMVKNIKISMAKIAMAFYDYPHKKLKIIGITGTKGKTTTTYFIKNVLESFTKKEVGIISTVEVQTGKRKEEAHLTTPEALILHKYFKEMVDSDIKYCVMEVSSQAYKEKRVQDICFDIGMFLNISEDHISSIEHPDFEDYFSCKLELMKNCKQVVVNHEMDFLERVLECAKNAESIIKYSVNDNKSADYYITSIKATKEGYISKMNYLNQETEIETSILGRFNVENALAAFIVGKLLNIDEKNIKDGIFNTKVPGRMNIFEKDNVKVIVDYAHNFLSFTKFFETIKLDFPNSRIITVAGGPGGKALKRREDLGKIASQSSDYMYLTAEDPAFEEVKDICEDIAKHVTCDYEIVVDRKEAIEKAIKNAKSGDIIAVLAKGEELYQKVKGQYEPYESDIAIVKRLMSK